MIFKNSFKVILPIFKRFNATSLLRRYSNKPNLLEIPIPKVLLSKANLDQTNRFDALVDELNQLHEIMNEADSNLENLVNEDLRKLRVKFLDLQNDIIDTLTKDEYSNVNECFLEIKAGVGGQEAMLFAAELLQIYLKYIKWHGWMIASVEDDLSELGGLKHAALSIKGFQVFTFLRHEAGVHRIQRVPSTERSGRIHTSTASVGILPLRNLGKIDLKDADLKFEATTSSGPGGQHVNRTETCARVVHLPTNLQVVCQETRSYLENKERALQRLKSLLARRENELHYANYQKLRREQYGDSGRSEKIRTYNIVQDRVTDHRLNENLYHIKDFMKGEPERLHRMIVKLEDIRKQSILKRVLVDCK
ncbi:peptide chain release factor 1-like, mitochondrial [Tetranychus urticae]|uniref:Peptide chain release factor domain-containing protein n=1 Tax=Tetranychus urticae TaxID=32264 RepID=T1K8W1_TETUR|nr:peptide chain release factor 1-like, mitochondrial [Tetranychus urticae]